MANKSRMVLAKTQEINVAPYISQLNSIKNIEVNTLSPIWKMINPQISSGKRRLYTHYSQYFFKFKLPIFML